MVVSASVPSNTPLSLSPWKSLLYCPFLNEFGAYAYDRSFTSVVTDPEDPRFDLEKLIAKWEAESQ